jgi:O-antigen ligase
MTATPWRDLGDAFVARYARSWWRLPLLLVGTLVAVCLPLYLVRGPRLVILAAAGSIAIAIGAFAFARPFQTLLFAIGLGFSGFGRFLPGPETSALIAVVAARGLFDLARGNRALVLPTRVHRAALAVLVAAALASLLVVHDWPPARHQLISIGFGIATAFAVAQYADQPRRILAVCLAAAVGMAAASASVLVRIAVSGLPALLELATGTRMGRFGYEDPNTPAAFAVALLAPVAFALASVRGRGQRAALIAIALFMVLGVILSQSRGAMLVLGAALFWVPLRARRARGWVAGALVVLAIVAAVLPRSYWDRFEMILQLRGVVIDESLLLRQHAMLGAWQMFLEHPWLGIGLGNMGSNAPRFMLGEYVAHNTLIEVAATTGAVGLLAYVVWYGSGIGMALGAARRWRAIGRGTDALTAESIGVALVLFMGTAMFLSMPFYTISWILIGVATASHVLSQCAAPGRSAPSRTVPVARRLNA